MVILAGVAPPVPAALRVGRDEEALLGLGENQNQIVGGCPLRVASILHVLVLNIPDGLLAPVEDQMDLTARRSTRVLTSTGDVGVPGVSQAQPGQGVRRGQVLGLVELDELPSGGGVGGLGSQGSQQVGQQVAGGVVVALVDVGGPEVPALAAIVDSGHAVGRRDGGLVCDVRPGLLEELIVGIHHLPLHRGVLGAGVQEHRGPLEVSQIINYTAGYLGLGILEQVVTAGPERQTGHAGCQGGALRPPGAVVGPSRHGGRPHEGGGVGHVHLSGEEST
mmetsp:Transcript_40996/g.89333  ORF Transcript_40996/g.89333 Transcript_40996/m.89333 type:complete len:278 (+) Transcript_40996:236-1069(+)